jgi:hypothetical protein
MDDERPTSSGGRTLWARRLVMLAALLGFTTAHSRSCPADEGTLFRWSSGDPGDGGPKLDEPLVTDRPDFTEASVTVGRGVVQIESGYTYFFDDDGTTSVGTHTAPESLFRIGMFADWFEWRLAYTALEETTSETGVGRSTVSGSDDLYLGMKFALTGQVGILPEMALVPQMRVPSGSGGITAGETLPGVNWLYGWDVSDFIAVGGSTQVNRRLDDVTSQPYSEFAQSWTIGYSLTDQWGGYTEWFCLAPDGADSNHNENYFDGGLTYLVTDNVQLDIRAGVGLNDAATDMFAGLGLSIRSLRFAGD